MNERRVHRFSTVTSWPYLSWLDVGDPIRETDSVLARRCWVALSPCSDGNAAYVEAVRIMRGSARIFFAPVGSVVRAELSAGMSGSGQGVWNLVMPDVAVFAGDRIQVFGRSTGGDVTVAVALEGASLSAANISDAPLCGLSPGLTPAKDLLDRLRQVSGAAWRKLSPLGSRVRLRVRRKTW